MLCFPTREPASGRRERRYPDLDDEEGYYDPYDNGAYGFAQVEPECPSGQYRAFMLALPFCPLNFGFHMLFTHQDADKCCFCPCSRTLKLWTEKYGTGGHTCETSHKSPPGKFTPHALIDHLESHLGSPSFSQKPHMFHFIVLEYLKILYTDYWNTDNGPTNGPTSHKAFYKRGNANYNCVEAAVSLLEAEHCHVWGVEDIIRTRRAI